MLDWALYKNNFDDKRYVSYIFEQYMPTRVAMQVEFHLLIFLCFVFHNFATLALDKLSPSCGAGRGAKFITGEAMASGRAQPPMQPILAKQIQIQDDHSCKKFLHNKYKYKMTTVATNSCTTNTNSR